MNLKEISDTVYVAIKRATSFFQNSQSCVTRFKPDVLNIPLRKSFLRGSNL